MTTTNSYKTKLTAYYSHQISKKVDLHLEAFLERCEALKNRDCEKAEYLERMTLEPLNQQIKYLAEKASNIFPNKP